MRKTSKLFPKKPLLLAAAAAVAVIILAFVPAVAMATSYSQSSQVAVVPSTTNIGPGYTGQLPTSGGGFNAFTFSSLPEANISAANLAPYDTVVLYQDCDLGANLTPSQKSDLNNWVSAGHKLIIYDSDSCNPTDGTTPDWSWLAFPFQTNNPGQLGSHNGSLSVVENDTLASADPPSAYYIDTGSITTNTDAVGDANVMVTHDMNWYGNMSAVNANGVHGWVHTYATLGSGLVIYNGLDTDFMDTDPGLQKIWLQELQQPWNPDGLPHLNSAAAKNYYWTWYDNVGMRNWVLMANPAGRPNLSFNLTIAGKPYGLSMAAGNAPGVVQAGKTLTAIYPGIIGGPVKVTSKTGDSAVVSQRSLMGNSFEEVLGTDADTLSNHFFWTWYDQQSPGFTNWVLVANPSATEAVHVEISIAGKLISQNDIAPGQRWTPTFPGKIGGPVEVKAYLKGGTWAGNPRDVIASQRVLSNFGTAFNEVPGIPSRELKSDYLWTWYDNASPGATDWVLIANAGFDHSGNPQGTVTTHVKIGNTVVGTYHVGAGQRVTPTFPGVMGGPVEVWTDSGDVIASQRTTWGPSFEEVPGYGKDALASDYNWTWYDMQSPGAANWILIANPNGSPVTYTIKIGGVVPPGGTGIIPAYGRVTPTFPGKMNGPVEVSSTGGVVMASQRVTWNGYFNEVLGTVLN